ncbi:hypothetical protein [Luteimicrobium album]|uniref:hypothetical protein n=1 Tax=Luteimicrobium album TaxID=1054550 RepID=UPI0024E188C2|nr:hypothetical protein [Luteimicrobium album]
MTRRRGHDAALPEPWERELRRMEVLARLETARTARRVAGRPVRLAERRVSPR